MKFFVNSQFIQHYNNHILNNALICQVKMKFKINIKNYYERSQTLDEWVGLFGDVGVGAPWTEFSFNGTRNVTHTVVQP